MNRMQVHRSSVAGARPIGRFPGELAINWPDKQLSVVDAANQPLDLVAVRYFSADANYPIGSFVVEAGQLWRSIVAVVPAPFDPAQWMSVEGAVAEGGAGVVIGDTPPATPAPGDLWFDSVGGQLYVWYDDGSSQQWVIAVNATQDLSAYAEWAGGDFTGPISGTDAEFSGGVASSIMMIYAPAGTNRILGGYTGATVVGSNLRWGLAVGDATPESGGDSGSDFGISRCNDAGVQIDNPLKITRATGNASFAYDLSAATMHFGAPTRTDFTAYFDTVCRFQWATNWYNQWDPATGARIWVCNNQLGMQLDATGNLTTLGTVNGVNVVELLQLVNDLRNKINALEDQIARPKGAR